jgi:hypothetical protein
MKNIAELAEAGSHYLMRHLEWSEGTVLVLFYVFFWVIP